jgi:hypothetical protein
VRAEWAARPWARGEDAVLAAAYPDYDRAHRRLPHRTRAALKHRAAKLDIVRRRHVWTAPAVRRLTTLVAANASNIELARAFPHLRLTQIAAKIGHLGLPKRKIRLAVFDDLLLDGVRQRAVEEGLSLRDLDRLAATGRYFQSSTRRLVLAHVARAIAILDGDVVIQWNSGE